MHENGLSSAAKSASAAEPPQRGDSPMAEQGAIPPDSRMLDAIPRTDCGDFEIRIGRDGTWFYKNSPIGRPALVKLFASVLTRDAAGDYWLETPAERGRIAVEDAPFVAVEMTVEGQGDARRLSFRTNIDAVATADAAHPIVMRAAADGAPRPYLLLGDGIEALIARSVFYALVDIAETRMVNGAEMLGVRSAGAFFALGLLPPDAADGTPCGDGGAEGAP